MDNTCPTCSASREPDANYCKRCGRIFGGERIPNHLWKSVIAAILFPIPGLVAVFYSARVNSRLSDGDRAGAVEDSRLARSWAVTTISTVVCLMVVVLVMSVLSDAI